jgi:EmrB/QacA subfamily drug resistance transporter
MPAPAASTRDRDDRTATGRWVVFAAVLASSMAFIDQTALNLALPALQTDLRTSGPGLLWLVNAYGLVVAALLLAGGALGDRYGRKRIFMLGIALFSGASLACGLAPSVGMLIAARAVQGVGGALMIPGSLALISAFFAADRRGKAIGTWSACCVVVTALGPVAGGLLAQAGLWRGIFLLNLPLAVIALLVLALRVPESRRKDVPIGVDYAGAVTAAIGLACLNYGLIEAADRGLRDGPTLGALGGGVVALLLFIVVEARAVSPMLPLELFQTRLFTAAVLLTVCVFAAFHGMLFFLSLNLIQVQGYDASLAGLAQLPVMLCLVVLSRWTGRLADRYGPRPLLLVGSILVGGGFFLLALPGVTAGPTDFWVHFLPGLAVLGVGLALTLTPLNTVTMGAVPGDRSGLASAISASASRLAGVCGLALLGALALVIFRQFLTVEVEAHALPPEVGALLRSEAAQLGNAQPPAGLDPGSTAAASAAIRDAFVRTFRVVACTAAGLAWLGTLIVGCMMRGARKG